MRHANRVAVRQHAAGRAGLDDVRTILRLVAHRRANLVRAVGHAGSRIAVHQTWLVAVLVAVTAGNAERVTSVLHARPDDHSFADHFAQRHVVEVRRAHVADRREAAEQRLLCVGDSDDRAHGVVVVDGRRRRLRVIELAPDDVRVRIDESRQDRRVAEVDHARSGWNVDRSLFPDRNDLVVGNDDDAIENGCRAGAIDDSSRAEGDSAGTLRFLRVRDNRGRAEGGR